MKLIVGLGNPGSRYAHTRHNVGFMVVDALAEKFDSTWSRHRGNSQAADMVIRGDFGEETTVKLLKPQTYMNESGTSVQEISRFHKVPIADVWVIHDDLDLPLGRIKLDENASAGGHHGIESIITSLGTSGFKRFRIGIGRPVDQKPADAFVLEPFTSDEMHMVQKVINYAVDAVVVALKQGFTVSQNQTNAK